MSDRGLYFNFSGYGGFDIFLSLLPKSWQVRKIARLWLRMLTPRYGESPDPTKTPMIIQMPWGSFRVIDTDGNVEPCKRESFPGIP